MTTIRLLVMTPPQDIEMRILSFRSGLFSRMGYTSALALPVMIPLCSFQKSISMNILYKALSSYGFAGFPMTGLKVVPILNSFFLSVHKEESIIHCARECKQLVSSLSDDPGAESPDEEYCCVPFYPGFFLAQNEKNSDRWSYTLKDVVLPVISYKHFFVSVCAIHLYSGPDTWWEHCEWEILFQVKSRK